jgi:hypothetical protein
MTAPVVGTWRLVSYVSLDSSGAALLRQRIRGSLASTGDTVWSLQPLHRACTAGAFVAAMIRSTLGGRMPPAAITSMRLAARFLERVDACLEKGADHWQRMARGRGTVWGDAATVEHGFARNIDSPYCVAHG